MANSQSYSIVGTEAHWGADDIGVPASYGTVQSWTKTSGASSNELKDANGQVVGICRYDSTEEFSCECICPSTLPTLPNAYETVVTVDNVKYLCTNATITARNEDWARLSMTLVKWQGVTLS